MNSETRIRELRTERGLSQAQLGEVLNAAQTTVSGWENSGKNPDIPMLKRMAGYFGVSVDYLICYSDSRSSDNCSRSTLEGYSKPLRSASLSDPGIEPKQVLYDMLSSLYSVLSKLKEQNAYHTLGLCVRGIEILRLMLEQALEHMQTSRSKTIPVSRPRRAKASARKRRPSKPTL